MSGFYPGDEQGDGTGWWGLLLLAAIFALVVGCGAVYRSCYGNHIEEPDAQEEVDDALGSEETGLHRHDHGDGQDLSVPH
jgi:MYXO-CTERM domain-containing protein